MDNVHKIQNIKLSMATPPKWPSMLQNKQTKNKQRNQDPNN